GCHRQHDLAGARAAADARRPGTVVGLVAAARGRERTAGRRLEPSPAGRRPDRGPASGLGDHRLRRLVGGPPGVQPRRVARSRRRHGLGGALRRQRDAAAARRSPERQGHEGREHPAVGAAPRCQRSPSPGRRHRHGRPRGHRGSPPQARHHV
ncbi:MAG: hypothetical protein AVDCRST_MAG34-1687, partial [uncultured Nocardioidaceae bacterium]